ncbi:hypothetical protein BSL78_12548 [Apostichopus japonicus]|uniref:Uncharacterized protein n=1 Tax=Stichopus japonicus TaxID=307972 RepID=A0A2G8KRD5_STIJA|nr:hypothetical protein BSL78_12548 [Apostichopus japonicus]
MFKKSWNTFKLARSSGEISSLADSASLSFNRRVFGQGIEITIRFMITEVATKYKDFTNKKNISIARNSLDNTSEDETTYAPPATKRQQRLLSQPGQASATRILPREYIFILYQHQNYVAKAVTNLSETGKLAAETGNTCPMLNVGCRKTIKVSSRAEQ